MTKPEKIRDKPTTELVELEAKLREEISLIADDDPLANNPMLCMALVALLKMVRKTLKQRVEAS